MFAGREVFFVKNYVGLCSSEIICISQDKGVVWRVLRKSFNLQVNLYVFFPNNFFIV